MNKKLFLDLKYLRKTKQGRKLSKALRKTLAFGLATAMCCSAMFSDFDSEWIPDLGISTKTSADEIYELSLGNSGLTFNEDNEEITINTVSDLIKLSHVEPSDYKNYKISVYLTSGSEVDLTKTTNESYCFQGLGGYSEESSFKGEFTINADDPLVIGDAPLFKYLSASAKVTFSDNGIKIAPGEHSNPVIAEVITGSDKEMNLSVTIQSGSVDCFGGLIGRIEHNANVTLGVINKETLSSHLTDLSDGYLRCRKKGNIGFFCSEIFDSSLCIKYSCEGDKSAVSENSSMISVVSDEENAGLAVGYAENSVIIVGEDNDEETSINIYGQVYAEKAAGGFIGFARDSQVILKNKLSLGTESDKVVDILGRQYTGLFVNGKNFTGGFAGKYVVSDTFGFAGNYVISCSDEENSGFDFSKFYSNMFVRSNDLNELGPIGITETRNPLITGGLFGQLYNKSATAPVKITTGGAENSFFSVDSDIPDKITGGIVGEYRADSLASSLEITGAKSDLKLSSNSAVQGGTIGKLTGSDNAETSNGVYVRVSDVVVDNNGSCGTSCGGIIGVSSGSDFIDIGSVKVNCKFDNGTNTGGLVGSMDKGVIRISGKTDLSDSEFVAGGSHGQILGKRGDVLVYATEGWAESFVRPNNKTGVSDIGTWGEVICLNSGTAGIGREMTEVDADEAAADQALLVSALIIFDKKNHTAAINDAVKKDSQSGRIVINNLRDFAALSMGLSCRNTCASLILDGLDNTIINNMDDYYSSVIELKSSIDLTDSGITGFLRDDGTQKFSGTFMGNNHTVKISAGEIYPESLNSVQPSLGCGQIYSHSHNGLFAKTENAKLKDLKLSGTMNIASGTNAGMLIGEATGKDSTELYNIIIDKDAVINSGSVTNVGGIIGNSTAASTGIESSKLVIETCSYNGTINESAASAAVGGFVGSASGNVTVVGNNTSICGQLNLLVNNIKAGGVIGVVEGKNENADDRKTVIEIVGTKVNGLNINANQVTSTSGGFLGYSWDNCNVDFKNIIISDSELNSSASFGGLIYAGSGHWRVGNWRNSNEAGITLKSSNKITGKTNNDNPSSLFVSRADNRNGNGALLLEIDRISDDNLAYIIESGINVSVSDRNKYFDEIAGRTINPDGNGVVSIKSDTEYKNTHINPDNTLGEFVGIDREGCNTYTNQLTEDYNNPKTRYYYDLDSIFTRIKFNDSRTQTNNKDEDNPSMNEGENGNSDNNTENSEEPSVNEDTDINSDNAGESSGDEGENSDSENADGDKEIIKNKIEKADELMFYSIGKYASENLKQHFGSYVASPEITGTIDLRGYSYYPIEMQDNVFINKCKIIFDNESIEKQENGNKQTTNANKQHYMMQTGLFTDVINPSKPVKFSVNDLSLCGTVGKTGDYCGVLINHRTGGSSNGTYIFNADGIVLDGICITGYTGNDYAPLLINNIGSYSDIIVSGVNTTENYNTEDNKTPVAASSLIGNVGDSTAEFININFSDIALNARTFDSTDKLNNTYSSVFSRASLLESFSYAGLTSSGQYNFSASQGYTYGQELSNTGAEGRNPGKQFFYMYTNTVVKDGDITADSEDKNKGFKNGNYLRYVYIMERENAQEYSHEIDINQNVEGITEGCGTYDNPYIIKTGGQLEALALYLSGKSPDWVVTIDTKILDGNNLNKVSNSVHNDNDDKEFTYVSSRKQWEDKNGNYYDTENFTQYLRNAYYLIDNDENGISLGSPEGTYTGIGSYKIESTSSDASFCGVICGKVKDGKCPKVTIHAPADPVAGFGGLVSYASGCVIKDIEVDYSDCDITILANRSGSGIINSNSSKEAYEDNPIQYPGNNVEMPEAQRPQNQAFFGGVIGYAFGGDNIIDNVKVTGLDSNRLKVTGIDNLNYDYLANIGGYVGLVGGNALGLGGKTTDADGNVIKNEVVGKYGGGVVFRNIEETEMNYSISMNNGNIAEAKKEADEECYSDIIATKDENNENDKEFLKTYDGVKDANILYNHEQYFYVNPYVGRVLDGYACAEDITLNNTDKNYTIPKLDTSKSSLLVTKGTVDVNDDQALWVLSAIVNSGAGYIENGTFASNAYKFGKVRSGSYGYIGDGITNDSGALADEQFWGGYGDSSTGKIPYLIKKYQDTDEILQYGNINEQIKETTTTKAMSIQQKNNYDAFKYSNLKINDENRKLIFTATLKNDMYSLFKIAANHSVMLNLSPDNKEQVVKYYVVYTSNTNNTISNNNNNTIAYKLSDEKYEHIIIGEENVFIDVDEIVNLNSIDDSHKNNLYLLIVAEENVSVESLHLSVIADGTEITPNVKFFDGLSLRRSFKYVSGYNNVLFDTSYVSNGITYSNVSKNSSRVEIKIKSSYNAKFYISSTAITTAYNDGKTVDIYAYNGKFDNEIQNGYVDIDLTEFRRECGLSDNTALYVLVTFTDDETSTLNYNTQIDKSLNLIKNSEFEYCVKDSSGNEIYKYIATKPNEFYMADELNFVTADLTVGTVPGPITNLQAIEPDGSKNESRCILKPISLDNIITMASSLSITNNTGDNVYYYLTDSDDLSESTVLYKSGKKAKGTSTTISLNQSPSSGLYLLIVMDTGSNSQNFYKRINGGITYTVTGINTGGSVSSNININDDCDMRAYGNGFRGIGSGYTDNVTRLVKERTLSVKTLNGNNNIITINRKGHEYSEETWWTQAEGLFPIYNFSSALCNVNSLKLKGNVMIFYADKDYLPKIGEQYTIGKDPNNFYSSYDAFIGEACIGGFGGMSAYNNSFSNISNNYIEMALGAQSNKIKFRNFRVEEMAIEGGKYCGGFIGVAGQFNRVYKKVWRKQTSKGVYHANYNPKTIGSIVGDYIFDSCGYRNLEVKGVNAVGGFIGNIKNNTNNGVQKTVTLSGETEILSGETENNNKEPGNRFTITRDAIYEYSTNSTTPHGDDSPGFTNNVIKDNAAKYYCYVGAGGIIGFCDASLYINNAGILDNIDSLEKGRVIPSKDEVRLELNNLNISAPQISFNSDYGLGAVAGSVINNSGKSNPTVVCNIVVNDCTIGTPKNLYYNNVARLYDTKMDFPSEGKSYRNYNAGGIFGYSKSIVSVYNCEVNKTTLINSPYTGGIVANVSSKNLYIINTSVSDSIIYNSDVMATKRASGAGGLVGHLQLSSVFINDTVSDSYIITNGSSGGIAGYYNSSNISYLVKMKNIKIQNNVIATTRFNSTVNAYNGSTLEAPTKVLSDSVNGFKSTDACNSTSDFSFSGKAGGLIGSRSSNENKNAISCYNILLKDNNIGYVQNIEKNNVYSRYAAKGQEDFSERYPVYSFDDFNDNIKTEMLDYLDRADNIKQSVPNEHVFESDENSDIGLDGIIIGLQDENKNLNNMTIKITGLSVQGSNQPFEYNGYNNNSNAESYIIRADYTGTSTSDSVYSPNPNQSETYVTDNPYIQSEDITFTGDGISQAAREAVMKGLTSETAPDDYPNTYAFNDKLKLYAQDFIDNKDENEDKSESNIKLVKFDDLEKGVTGDWANLPVLYIKTNDSSEINRMIQEYISIMTGTDQMALENAAGQNVAGFNGAKIHQYKKEIGIKAYNIKNGKLVESSEPASIEIKGDNVAGAQSKYIKFISKAGCHDNGKTDPQFTMIDVKFESPVDAADVYHLYVPVYVERVLEFSFHASLLNDTNYYPKDYDSAKHHVISNFGDKITGYVRFDYYRSASEWLENLKSGENLLWNFKKRIYLGNSKIPDGSVLTLVDHNTGGTAYSLTVKNGDKNDSGTNVFKGDITDSNSGADKDYYYVDLTQFKRRKNVTSEEGEKTEGWLDNAVYLCDLLKLNASAPVTLTSVEDISEKFVRLDSSDKSATCRVKTVSGYDYYRPAVETDIITNEDGTLEPIELYELSIGDGVIKPRDKNKIDTDNFTGQDKAEYLEESYFLTIQVNNEDDNIQYISNTLEYRPNRLDVSGYVTSIQSGNVSMPTIKVNKDDDYSIIIESDTDIENNTETDNNSENINDSSFNYVISNGLHMSDNVKVETNANSEVISPDNNKISVILSNEYNIPEPKLLSQMNIGNQKTVPLFQEYLLDIWELKIVNGISVDKKIGFNNENTLISYQFEIEAKNTKISDSDGKQINKVYTGEVHSVTEFGDTLYLRADENFVDSDSAVTHSLMDILKANSGSDNVTDGIIVRCKVDAVFSDKGVIDFPEKQSSLSKEGRYFKAESYVAYSAASVLSSSLHNSGKDSKNMYYREKINYAKLNYNALSSEDETGQLGINPLELDAEGKGNSSDISSLIQYNYSGVDQSIVEKCDRIGYEMTLYVKGSDDTYGGDGDTFISNNEEKVLKSLDFGKYFVDTGTEGKPEYIKACSNPSDMKLSTDNENGIIKITWTEPLNSDNESDLQVTDVSFSVISGSDFEEAGHAYANYKVLVKAYLIDDTEKDSGVINSEKISDSEAEDYLIYTHAKNLLEMYIKDSQ